METREFVELQGEFESTNTVTVGLSTDNLKRLKRFRESQGITFPLVSDRRGRVARMFDVRRRFGLGTSRATFVIDAEGVIRDAYHNELSMWRHAHRALASVKSVQGARSQ